MPASILPAVPQFIPPPPGHAVPHRPALRLRVLDARTLLTVVFAVYFETESREHTVRFFRNGRRWTCNCASYPSRRRHRQLCVHAQGVSTLADSLHGVQNILRLAGEANNGNSLRP